MEFIVALLFIVLFCIVYGKLIKNPNVPGPFPLPIIGSLYVFLGYTSTKRILNKWIKLNKKYDGTMSVWIGHKEYIMISKPEHVQVYMTSHLLLDHAPLYDHFKLGVGDGLFTANGADWKAKRKAWAPSFHPSVLRHFVKNFQDQAEIMTHVLEKELDGPEFPSFPYLRNFYIDCLFVNQLEYNHNSQLVPHILNETAEPLNEMLYERTFTPHYQFDAIFKLTSSGRKCLKIMKQICTFLDEFIEIKKKDLENVENNPAEDWKNNLFVRQLFNERKASKKEMYDEILTLGVTGYETVARATGFILLMLGKHQDVQDKVFREDLQVQRELNGRELTVDDLKKYEYLERVIKETLRIFPVGPLLGRMATGDLMMGDLEINKGTPILFFMIGLHRDPEIYPNPMEFNPDNFLPERVAERHPYSYVPFSGGPRGCIGIKYGMTAMKILVTTLLRKYRVISNKATTDINVKLEVTMTDVDDFVIRLEKRTIGL